MSKPSSSSLISFVIFSLSVLLITTGLAYLLSFTLGGLAYLICFAFSVAFILFFS